MKMIPIVLAAMLVIDLTAGQQAIVQPANYPLTGFYQPLTFPSLPDTNVFQQPSQQQQTTSTVQQQQLPLTATVQQPATTAFLAQPQSANVATIQQQQQQQPAPPPAGPAAVVNSVRADGTYAFGYQTPDGQLRAESVQADGTRQGSYTYRTPEGQLITINYTAGRHGFQTSPATTVPASVPTVAETPSIAPVAAPAPPAAQAVAPSTGTSGVQSTPVVLYTGLPGYYPFAGYSAQPSTGTASAAQSGANINADAELIQPAQTQGAAYAAQTTPAISAPVGFSYGSNPQAIQQLQRLLLV